MMKWHDVNRIYPHPAEGDYKRVLVEVYEYTAHYKTGRDDNYTDYDIGYFYTRDGAVYFQSETCENYSDSVNKPGERWYSAAENFKKVNKTEHIYTREGIAYWAELPELKEVDV